MRTYWHTTGELKTLDKWQPNCWVQVTCPTQEDKDFLENTLGIPDYFISDIADTDERARKYQLFSRIIQTKCLKSPGEFRKLARLCEKKFVALNAIETRLCHSR